jgi:hypothetical protein
LNSKSISGYQRVLSGSGRGSDKTLELNIDPLPKPTGTRQTQTSFASATLPIPPATLQPGYVESDMLYAGLLDSAMSTLPGAPMQDRWLADELVGCVGITRHTVCEWDYPPPHAST